jgi:hypothetical protein
MRRLSELDEVRDTYPRSTNRRTTTDTEL